MRDKQKYLREQCFGNLNLEEQDIKFLRMCVDKNTTPQQLADYYKTIDFENLTGQHVCALAELSTRLHYEGVPRALNPRVRGVARYYRMMNLGQMQDFHVFLKICNQQGIDVMLMKGGAMKGYYKKNGICYMGDVDCWVRYEDFERLCKLMQNNPDYESFVSMPHLVLKRERYYVEAHQFFLKENLHKNNEDIFWKDAISTEIQGEKVFVPAPEAMLILILTNIFLDATEGDSVRKRKRMRWITDIHTILEEQQMDWDQVLNLCERYSLGLQVKTMLDIFDGIMPGKIPEGFLEKIKVAEMTVKKIPVMLKRCAAHRMGQEIRGKKRFGYAWLMLKYHWNFHRYVSEKFCLWTDLFTFPNYIKKMWGCKTWKEWIMYIFRKIKNVNNRKLS